MASRITLDRYPGNEPGPNDTLFATPTQYPPTPISDPTMRGGLCSFSDGNHATHLLLGYSMGGTTTTPVCPGHRDAAIAGELSWI